MTSDTIQTVE